MKTGRTQVETYRVQRCYKHKRLQDHEKCHKATTNNRSALKSKTWHDIEIYIMYPQSTDLMQQF